MFELIAEGKLEVPIAGSYPLSDVQGAYRQLASGLQTGSLAQAQSSFAALQQVLQTQAGDNTNSTTSSSADPISNDLSTLGAALSSGDLTQAQSAFSQLQNDIQNTQPNGTEPPKAQGEEHHHHHHGEAHDPRRQPAVAVPEAVEADVEGAKETMDRPRPPPVALMTGVRLQEQGAHRGRQRQ